MTNPKTSKSRPKKPRPTAGQAFRDAVLGLYVLDPSERTLLDRIAALLDIVTGLEEQIAAGSLTAKGSRGQDVPNPLLVVHRGHTQRLAALIDQLQLPRLHQEQGHPSPAHGTGHSFPARLDEHLEALRAVGFTETDCFWKDLRQALYGGYR